ncbi:hypothetical protein Pfo_001433 [Paulownia fortunei]|nr:hypothetical protein Pfo_001433 [Paulownia fortunei]
MLMASVQPLCIVSYAPKSVCAKIVVYAYKFIYTHMNKHICVCTLSHIHMLKLYFQISKKDTEEVTVEGMDELPSREYEEKGKQLLTKYREIRKKMMIKDSEDVKSLKEDDKFIKVEGAANNKRDKRWNLRDRKSFQLTKAVSPTLIAGLPSKAVREKDKQPKSGKGKKEKQEEEDLPKLPNFSLELKLEEISEDLFAVMGKMPSRKMNKRKKNVQKQIDLIFPGGNLEAITVDRYKVSGDTRTVSFSSFRILFMKKIQ